MGANENGQPAPRRPDRGGGSGGREPELPPKPGRSRNGRKGRRTVLPGDGARARKMTPEQKLLVLDVGERSALPARDFAPLVGLSSAVLYRWRKRFRESGPAGLEHKQRGATGSRLDETTRRAILLMKRRRPGGRIGCITS